MTSKNDERKTAGTARRSDRETKPPDTNDEAAPHMPSDTETMSDTDIKQQVDRAKDPVTEDEPGGKRAAGPGAGAEESGPPVSELPGEGVADDDAVDDTDYRDRWLRAEAELQNYRRRAMRDRAETQRFTEERYLNEMISLLDDLGRALEAAGDDAPHPWVEGVRLVAKRMTDYLAQQGVTPIEALGQPFDPERHEALLELEAAGSAKPGDVVQEIRKGYQRHGRALRATRVAVAKAPVEESGDTND